VGLPGFRILEKVGVKHLEVKGEISRALSLSSKHTVPKKMVNCVGCDGFSLGKPAVFGTPEFETHP